MNFIREKNIYGATHDDGSFDVTFEGQRLMYEFRSQSLSHTLQVIVYEKDDNGIANYVRDIVIGMFEEIFNVYVESNTLFVRYISSNHVHDMQMSINCNEQINVQHKDTFSFTI